MTKVIKSAMVACAGIFGVALGLIVSFLQARPRPAAPPPFHLVGPANVSTGFATFQITNENRRPIVFGVLPPQVRSNEQWIDVQPPSGRSAILAPGQTSTFVTIVPSNGLLWRVPVWWSPAPTKPQLWKRRAENFLLRKNQGLALESHVVYSPEVTP